MGSDFSIRPVGAPVATPVVQAASQAAHAVKTELPAPKSVTAADAGVRTRNDAQIASANVSVSHQVVLDRAAGSIVYQVVDNRTSMVVAQFPDEAVLRRRAYFHALDMTKGEPTRQLATDRKV